MSNWGPSPTACWYQYRDRCPEIGEQLSVTCCPLPLTRCLGVWVTSESTGPVGEEGERSRGQSSGGSLLLRPSSARLYYTDGKRGSEAFTLRPGLTCSQETKGHAAEKPGAHGNTGKPRYHSAWGWGLWGRAAESSEPPVSLKGVFAYDVTRLPRGRSGDSAGLCPAAGTKIHSRVLRL